MRVTTMWVLNAENQGCALRLVCDRHILLLEPELTDNPYARAETRSG